MTEGLDLTDTLQTALVLVVAFALGTPTGAGRQDRQRGAGLGTSVLVAVGAASFVDLGVELEGHPGATQVVACAASGVGLLGAGVISRGGGEMRGPDGSEPVAEFVFHAIDAAETEAAVRRLETFRPRQPGVLNFRDLGLTAGPLRRLLPPVETVHRPRPVNGLAS